MTLLLDLLREPCGSGTLKTVSPGSEKTLSRDAERHGLAAWLFSSCAGAANETLDTGLREAALSEVARQLRLTRALRRLLARCEEASLTPVLLKGPAFAARYYPEASQRPCSDLDVLVAPKEVPLARTVLLDLGYREVEDAGSDHEGVD